MQYHVHALKKKKNTYLTLVSLFFERIFVRKAFKDFGFYVSINQKDYPIVSKNKTKKILIFL